MSVLDYRLWGKITERSFPLCKGEIDCLSEDEIIVINDRLETAELAMVSVRDLLTRGRVRFAEKQIYPGSTVPAPLSPEGIERLRVR